MRLFQELGEGGGFELSCLTEFGVEQVESSARSGQESAHEGRTGGGDRGVVTDGQLGGERLDLVGEQAIGHRPIQQGGHNAAMEQSRITLEQFTVVEGARDTAVGLKDKFLMQAAGIIGAADHAMGVGLKPVGDGRSGLEGGQGGSKGWAHNALHFRWRLRGPEGWVRDRALASW